MIKVTKGKYKEIMFIGNDVYGFRESYSFKPVKLTKFVTAVKCIDRQEMDTKDATTAICVGLLDGLAGLITLGILGSKKTSTYQLVIQGEEHIITTDERGAKKALEMWTRKFI